MLRKQFYYYLAGIAHISFAVIAYGEWQSRSACTRIVKTRKKPERHNPRPCLCDKAKVKRVRLICMYIYLHTWIFKCFIFFQVCAVAYLYICLSSKYVFVLAGLQLLQGMPDTKPEVTIKNFSQLWMHLWPLVPVTQCIVDHKFTHPTLRNTEMFCTNSSILLAPAQI